MSEGESEGLGMYNNMDRSDIRPDLPGDDSRKKEQQAEKNKNASDTLRNNESAASGVSVGSAGDGVDTARNAEGDFSYNNSGNGLVQMPQIGIKKKKGPILTIFFALMGLGGLTAGSQTLAPFALVSNGLDQFNMLRTSLNRRSTHYMKFATSNKLNRPVTSRTIFGNEKFKISSKLQGKLAKRNIEYIESGNTKLLVYDSPNGEGKIAIYANEKDLNTGRVSSVEIDGVEVQVSGHMTLDKARMDLDGFALDLDIGTRTLKGHIAGWFESISDALHNRIKNTRNKFRDVGDNASDEDIKKAAKNGTMEESIDGSRGKVSEDPEETETQRNPDTGEEEEVSKPPREITDEEKPLKAGSSEADVEASFSAKAKKIAATVGAAGNIACGVLQAWGGINAAIAALQVVKIINYVTGFLEAIQKTQAGEASNELAYYMNGLTTPGNTKDAMNTKVVRENTTALSSRAWTSMFGGPQVSNNDEVGQKFNREYFSSNSIAAMAGVDGDNKAGKAVIDLISSAGNSIAAFQACTAIRAGMAVVDIVTDVVGIVTLGIGTVIKEAVSGAIKAATLAAIMAIVGVVIAKMTPMVAQFLAMDLIENMAGEDAAYAVNSGLNIYMGKQMQSNSGGVGTEEGVLAMYRETQQIIAEEAEYERATRSPFDVTSKHTFFGSIAYSLLPIGMSIGASLPAAISSASATVSGAVASLMPTVSAASDETWFERSLNHDCPALSAFDLVGDSYCNPYFVTDFDTMADDPYDVYVNVGEENFEKDENGEVKLDDDDNPVIAYKKGDTGDIFMPDLGKYIIACTLRESQFGTVDTTIGTITSGNAGVDTVMNTAVSLIPIGGGIADIADAAMQEAMLPWNTGEACVADKSQNNMWEKNKYYQRYIEDQTLLEASGLIKKSSISAFIEKYYADHPLDDSVEGIIARYSGMPKDEVGGIIALIEYVDFLAQYDATERYSFGEPWPEEYKVSFVDESEQVIYYVLALKASDDVVYPDLRNRTLFV